MTTMEPPIQILLVEDNPGDANLTLEAFRRAQVANEVNVVGDGEAAMAYLHRQAPFAGAATPDLVLLDLNLPLMNGHEVLAELKADSRLSTIPVVVLSTSVADEDVLVSYKLHASSYVAKPVDLDDFLSAVRNIEAFWLSTVQLPPIAAQT